MSKIIKSKERVRDLAEVFTSDREVNAMLGLLENVQWNIDYTFFEPSCGNGNFLVSILKKKLETIRERYDKQIDVDFYIIKAVASVYGVDISKENVVEARERMFYEIKNFYSTKFNTKKASNSFWGSIQWILKKNIIVGDMLNGIEKIVFIEYSTPKKYYFKRQEFRLADSLNSQKNKVATLFDSKKILENYKITSYLSLC